jgi:hypothetical protein
MSKQPLILLTAAVVGLFLTTAITVVYGSYDIPPPLSEYGRYIDPTDPDNMTKTCANVAEQNVNPMDILACVNYLDNATLIKHGFDPREKEPPLRSTDEPSPGLKTYKPTIANTTTK